MISVIFALVVTVNHPRADIEHIDDFITYEQCEIAGKKLSKDLHVDFTCIEKQVKSKRMKCNIKNDFSYSNYNSRGNFNAHNLDNYPYPTSFTCEEIE